MSLIFKIDTKGSCLLCLSPNSTVNNFDSRTAFKMLLRYLKVDWLKLLTSSSSAGNSDDVLGIWNCANLSVSLCEECSSVAKDFLELFQAFENIRMQLDLCVGQLHEFMEKGDNDSDRGQEYERRVNTGNLEDMKSASIAQKLRRETMEKASQKRSSSLPRISLQSSTTPSPSVENPVCSESPAPQLLENVEVKEKAYPRNQCELQDKISSPTILERSGSLVSVSLVEDHSLHPGNPMEQTQPSEITNVVKCNYCELRVNNTKRHYLQIHQYYKHAKSFLSDKGLLPPSISEQQLESALQNISGTGQPKAPTQCPFCKIWFKRKFPLRKHLLQNHLPQIIDEANKFPEVGALCHLLQAQVNNNCVQPQPQLRKRLNRCNKCGEYFHDIKTLIRHKLRKHDSSDEERLPSSPPEADAQIAAPERKYDPNSSIAPFSSSGPRYKCNFCMKITRTLVGLKLHYSLKHRMRITGSNRHFKCDYCQTTFSHENSLKVHLSLNHPAITYSALLPPATSHQDFNKAVTCIIDTIRGNMDGSTISVGNRILECPQCQHKMRQRTELRLHIIRFHLEKVIETIKSIRVGPELVDITEDDSYSRTFIF